MALPREAVALVRRKVIEGAWTVADAALYLDRSERMVHRIVTGQSYADGPGPTRRPRRRRRLRRLSAAEQEHLRFLYRLGREDKYKHGLFTVRELAERFETSTATVSIVGRSLEVARPRKRRPAAAT